MERKSFRHMQTYRSGKSWLPQIGMYVLSVHENHEAIAKSLSKISQGSTQMLPFHIPWTLWRPQDLIFIMSKNSCLERFSPISPRTLQFTLGLSIAICNSCFSDNFAKDADKAMWRFVAFELFRNFELKYFVRTSLSFTPQYLAYRSISSFCRILFLLSSYDITKYGEALSISAEHRWKK